jgi:hypothetical protein
MGSIFSEIFGPFLTVLSDTEKTRIFAPQACGGGF